jgi:hypothetical protein
MASVIRHVTVAVATTGAALLVAGCSGGSPSAAPTVTKTVTVKVTSSAPRPCQSSAVKVTLGRRAGLAASTTYLPIIFTNISSSACTLYGFPDVSFTGETYAVQVGPAASRNASPEHLVTLPPAGSASADFGVTTAANYGSGCGLTTVRGILVYPPNLDTAVGLPFKGVTCVNSRDIVLSVDAVVPGTGG